MNLSTVYEYYSREDVKNFIFEFSKNREVTGVFENGSFSERPNFIQYPNDTLAMVRNGIVEFHGSLEHWLNPMALKKGNYDELRIGWDLILDIDCKVFEHGKIATEAFIWGLMKHGIRNVSLKFTGGKGFHIGVPWGSFPAEINYKPTVKQYPELARTIALFLKYFVKERFEKNILKNFTKEELSKQIDKPMDKISTDDGINPYEIVDVDPVLISPRHFFRVPYSINRKTNLVSLPIDPDELANFKTDKAKIDSVEVNRGFLNKHENGEAGLLVAEASDWWVRKSNNEKNMILDEQIENLRKRGYRWLKREDIEKLKTSRPIEENQKRVPENLFPPCIKDIANGLSDGRKRSLLIMFNFLRSSKWNWDEIEKFILEWNKKNKPPLPESHVRSTIRWHVSRNKDVLPPNCANEGWYKNFGVCKPDERCKMIKNPVNYAIRGLRKEAREKPKKATKKRAHNHM